MFEAVEGMRQEHAEIEQRLALPETHADQRLAKELNQRYAELTAVVATWQDWLRLGDDIEAARELASDDPAFAQEADELVVRREVASERLRRLLVVACLEALRPAEVNRTARLAVEHQHLVVCSAQSPRRMVVSRRMSSEAAQQPHSRHPVGFSAALLLRLAASKRQEEVCSGAPRPHRAEPPHPSGVDSVSGRRRKSPSKRQLLALPFLAAQTAHLRTHSKALHPAQTLLQEVECSAATCSARTSRRPPLPAAVVTCLAVPKLQRPEKRAKRPLPYRSDPPPTLRRPLLAPLQVEACLLA